MYATYAEEMKNIDRRAINEYGIPGIVLMENAANSVFMHIRKLECKNIVVVCGGGNNGGDGFAIVRILLNYGYNTVVYCLKDFSRINGDAKINLDILLRMGVNIKREIKDLKDDILKSQLVVDAIFGTGISGEIGGIFKDAIEIINGHSRYTVAVDIPSGIDSNSGEKLGQCIYANDTITFECLKLGHLLLEGREASGRVYVEKISIPYKCIEEQGITVKASYGEYPGNLLRKRRIDSNKGNFGRVHIIGGSHLMSGAVILAAKAALNSGCGLATCVIPESILDRVGASVIEATYRTAAEKDGCIYLNETEMDNILNEGDVIALGPGIGRAHHIKDMISYMFERSSKPMVVDADGINALTSIKDKLKNAGCKIVLTPHPGEMSRLTGLDTNYINRNRINVARDFAKEYGCILLLKGSSTVVTDGERVYINTTGNPGMASGGSGDVLTGVIASLIGQGYEVFDAAVLGAYIHGCAGDKAYDTFGYGLTSGKIIDYLGSCL